jgi:hypothetical protein
MANRRFARDVRHEILRLLNEEHHAHITREEVVALGERAGLPPDAAAQQFLRLRDTT